MFCFFQISRNFNYRAELWWKLFAHCYLARQRDKRLHEIHTTFKFYKSARLFVYPATTGTPSKNQFFSLFSGKDWRQQQQQKIFFNLFSYCNFLSFLDWQFFAVSCLEVVENTNSSQTLLRRAKTTRKQFHIKIKTTPDCWKLNPGN